MEIVFSCDSLQENERKVVVITQDESSFYANDGKTFPWLENGKLKTTIEILNKRVLLHDFWFMQMVIVVD